MAWKDVCTPIDWNRAGGFGHGSFGAGPFGGPTSTAGWKEVCA